MRTCWIKCRKCYSTGPHQHLHRLYAEQLQGVAFSIGHDMTGPQDLCNPNLQQDLGIHSSSSKLLINKKELNFKTLREIFHSLLNLMAGRISDGNKNPRKEYDVTYSPHTYLTMHSEKATSPRSTSHFMLLSWLQVLREVQVLNM